MLEKEYQTGDINQDGQITKDDGLLLAEHFINNTLTDTDRKLGDVNKDGIINIKDAQEIYLMIDPNFLIGDATKDNIISVSDITSIYIKLENNNFTVEDIIYCDYFGDGIVDQTEIDIIMDFLGLGIGNGDINRDGVVNSIDASIVIDKYKSNKVYKDDLNRADMNGDNSLTSVDASMIIDMYKNNE